MATFTVSDGKGKNAQNFPPTHNLEIGASMCALALEIKRGVETKYGERDVFHIVTRDDENILKSFWWPRKAPFPPLNVPFILKRTAKNAWELSIADNDAEAIAMWKTGESPAGSTSIADGVPKVNGPAAAVLAKFK